MRHSPMSGFSCFLRISLAISSVTTLGALRACDLSSSPLTPSATQRFRVVYTVCLLTAKYSAMEETDHSLCVKGISFALQRVPGFASFLRTLNGGIPKKHDGAQQFVGHLLWPERILLDGLPVFGMLSLLALAFGHRVPSTR